MLDKIRIVLVNTSHPGNIGSVARAMKNMGLSQLYLVAPHQFPSPKAVELASGAADILDDAVVVPDLKSAIADCTLVFGTSARSRSIPWPLMTPKEAAAQTIQLQEDAQIAFVFGREQSGLTNEELHCCHAHIHIPANEKYSSLNLAQAVQVITYELFQASLAQFPKAIVQDYRSATSEEIENFFTHLETTLIQINFLKPSAPRQLMTRLRRLFFKAQLDVMEINILRGLLTAVQEVSNEK